MGAVQETVTVDAPDEPQVMVGAVPTVTVVGLRLMLDVATATPVPVRVMPVAPLVPLVATVTVPGRGLDVDDGVNDTLIVQVPLTARADEQLLDCAKSVAPAVTETPVTVRLALPVLVMVMDWVLLVVPTVWPANVSDVDEYDAVPCKPEPVEVEVKVPALVGTVNVCVYEVAAVGVNVMFTLQVVPAANELPQVLPV